MAGPAAVIVAGAITVWLAVRSADGLVDDDYYKQGLAVNQHIQRDREAAARGLAGELMLGGDGRQLRLRLVSGPGETPGATLRVHAAHPTRSGADQDVTVERGADGLYAGRFAQPLAGRWRITVEEAGAGWRLVGDWNVDAEGAVRLQPAAVAARAPGVEYSR